MKNELLTVWLMKVLERFWGDAEEEQVFGINNKMTNVKISGRKKAGD